MEKNLSVVLVRNAYREMDEQRLRVGNPLLNALYEMARRSIEKTFEELELRLHMSDFSKSIQIVIETHEGEFQDRRDDPGNFTPAGELKGTKYGISAHSFPDVDIENLTIQGAEEIYRNIYGAFAAIEDPRVLTKVLDLAINMEYGDHGPATKILQTAIAHCGIPVKIDGSFGPKTITACNNLRADNLLPALCDAAVAHYKEVEAKRPGMKGWFNNWEHRATWVPPLD